MVCGGDVGSMVWLVVMVLVMMVVVMGGMRMGMGMRGCWWGHFGGSSDSDGRYGNFFVGHGGVVRWRW